MENLYLVILVIAVTIAISTIALLLLFIARPRKYSRKEKILIPLYDQENLDSEVWEIDPGNPKPQGQKKLVSWARNGGPEVEPNNDGVWPATGEGGLIVAGGPAIGSGQSDQV